MASFQSSLIAAAAEAAADADTSFESIASEQSSSNHALRLEVAQMQYTRRKGYILPPFGPDCAVRSL